MFKWILLSLLSLNLYSLDISLQGARDNFESYSTLHIKDKNKFLCQEMKNDFDKTIQIICAFSKSPSKKLQTLQNDFFKIETKIKDKNFFVIITPYKNMKLYPVVFNLNQEDSVYKANVKLAHHWMIVGYNKVIPYIKNQEHTDVAINFPFFLNSNKFPYVGSLDIEGKPVHIQEIKDVNDYLRIKRYFSEKKYEKCLDLIEDVMLAYPSSLFNAELLYYKIKVSSKLNYSDNVIEFSKVYLREYSSDENVAEVLSVAAKAYSLNGMLSQADYFFDRLFNEHEDSPYAKWGYIYRGEMLEDSGSASKAVDYYKKALHNTSDIEIAATAAYKLAQYYLSNTKNKEASKYIMKIIKAKPNLFVSQYKSALEMMQSFADEEEFESAAAIAKALIDEIDDKYDELESIVKNRGIWLSKTTKKKEALLALDDYFKKFPDGSFDIEVQIAKDSLFFDQSDANISTRIAEYDQLIETYSEDSIGNRAIYEKAKLMRDNEMYSNILEFKDALLTLDASIYPDTLKIVEDAAKGVMEEGLKNRECYSVLEISNEYSIKLSDKWDDGIYKCAMKGADFLLAKEITSKNLKSKDLKIRKKWLYRYIKVDFATGNYSDVVKASEELISLIEDVKNSEYKDVHRVIFDTYQRLENRDKMIEKIINLQKVYGVTYKDIERYIAVMAIGSDKKDDNLVIKYAKDIMKIQNSSDSYAQSPFVEFTLYQSYINKDEFNQALELIKSLNTVEISKANRARQKYLLGTIYEKLWREDEAQKAYKESIEADATSPWAELAQGAKED